MSAATWTTCQKCGRGIMEIARRGAYLRRTSPYGAPFLGECSPNCDVAFLGGSATAVVRAIRGQDDEE